MILIIILGMYLSTGHACHQLSKISMAEKRAIEEGPMICKDLVPLVLSHLASPSDLYHCSQVSIYWSVHSNAAILRLCGRVNSSGNIELDFMKALSSPVMLYLVAPDLDRIEQLKYFVRKHSELIVPCQALRFSARNLISALPYLYESGTNATAPIRVRQDLIKELIDIGSTDDIISRLLAIPKEDSWDAPKLATYAMTHNCHPRLIKAIIDTSPKQSGKALLLAFLFYSKAIKLKSLIKKLRKVVSIPLCLLPILCMPETEETIRELIRKGVIFEGHPKDIDVLIQIHDLGTVGLEIATHMSTFKQYNKDSKVLRAHETFLLAEFDDEYIRLLVHMAFGQGPFGKKFADSMGGSYDQMIVLLEDSFYVAADTMTNLLKCSHGIDKKHLECLLKMINSVPFSEHLPDHRVFLELIKHPLLSNTEKTDFLAKYMNLTAIEPQFGCFMLSQLDDQTMQEVGLIHLVNVIFEDQYHVIDILFMIWKYIRHHDEVVKHVDVLIGQFKRESIEGRNEIVEGCASFLSKNITRALKAFERHFTQSCIIWSGLEKDKLNEFIINAYMLHDDMAPYELCMGRINAGVELPENAIICLFSDVPSLYCMTLYVSREEGLGEYLLEILDSNLLTEFVVRDLVLYAIDIDASEGQIYILLGMLPKIGNEVESIILSSLVQAQLSESSIRIFVQKLPNATLSAEALQAARNNTWYSEDLISILSD